jgi:hypothetical protein
VLQKILYPLVVNGGIDTKSDSALVEAGANLISENTALEELGALNKRQGFTELADDVDGVGPLSLLGVSDIFSHNNEIVAITDPEFGKVYSYDQTLGAWRQKPSDPLSPMIFTDGDYVDAFELNSIDSVEVPARGYRFTVCVYFTPNSASKYLFKMVVYKTDYVTGVKTVIYTYTDVQSSNNVPIYAKINSVNATLANGIQPVLWVTYLNETAAGVVQVRCKFLTDDGALNSDMVIVTGITDLKFWDTIVDGNDLIIVSQFGGVLVDMSRITQLPLAPTNNVIAVNNTIEDVRYCGIAITIYGNNLYVGYISNTPGDVKICAYGVNKTTLALSVAEVVVDPPLSPFYGKIAWYKEGSGANDKLVLFYSTNESYYPYHASTGTANSYVPSFTYFKRLNPSNLSTVATDTSPYPFEGMLAAKPFSRNGFVFVITQTLSPEGYKYNLNKFVTDGTLSSNTDYGLVHIGAFAIGIAYGDSLNAALDLYADKNFLLAEVMTGRDDKKYCPLMVQERSVLIYAPGIDSHVPTGFGIGRTFQIDFESDYHGINARLSENTSIVGAGMKEYDGVKMLNSSFTDVPIIRSLVVGAGVSTLGAGSYSYISVFEYTDNNGQVWRSPTSLPITITIAANKTIAITFMSPASLPVDLKNEEAAINSSIPRSFARIILYRTEKNGTVYRRLTAIDYFNGFIANPFTDDITDAKIDGNEILYTNGGVLSNDLVPPFKYLLTAKNRQFAISSEDENLVYYSQAYLSGECVNWSLALTIRVDAGTLSNTGKAIALAAVDDKIVVLKSSSVVAFVGDGPNQLGEDNNFSSPSLISANIGCTDPKSVVTVPAGVMFKSTNGIYLLDRGMNLQYIGAQVEAYNSETINAAQNIPKTNKVLMLTDNRSMIYDYLQGKWMTWTIGGQSACIWNDQIAILSNGVVKYQSTGYTDGASYYSMKMTSPWLKMSGVQEYQRIYKIILLGVYKSAHTLTVKIYFDYDATDFETHTVTPLITDKVYQYEIAMTNQKCQAFKIEIFDNVSAGTGQGFKLSNITLQVGQKRGFNKIAATRKY